MRTLFLLLLCPGVGAQGESVTSLAFVSAGGGSSSSMGTVAYTSLPDVGGGELSSPNFGIAPGFIEANEPVIPPLPIVYGFEPRFGAEAGGTTLTFTGVNFDDMMGGAGSLTVLIDGQPASGITLLSNTTFTCNAPPGPMGPAAVSVANGLGSAAVPDTYVYTPAVTSTFASFPGATITVTNYGTPGESFITLYGWNTLSTNRPIAPVTAGPGAPTPAFGLAYPAPDGVHVRTIRVPSDPSLGIKSLRVQTLVIKSVSPLKTLLTNVAETTIGP